jgi:hypothetical protein
MLLLQPARIAAVWMRSGSPRLLSAQAQGSAPHWPAASLAVPAMCNLGVKEKEGRFAKLWDSTLAFFQDFRAQGALIGLALDPRTSHECGDSRYLAIPWFDACLAQRLPDHPGAPLRPMPTAAARLASLFSDLAQAPEAFTGDVSQSIWLPTEAIARAWSHYVKTGAIPDTTPPPAPTNVRVRADGELTWEAEVDFESGLAGFIIERDDVELARLLQQSAGPFGRPLFQKMSYHDTPERPWPEMRFTDAARQPGAKHRYAVRAVNTSGLSSAPSAAVASP